MAGRIPESFVDELMRRIDIVEVIDARVPLKKSGRDFSACCPFHNEKTPSFTVSQSKQFFHCFGCGAHGTAIGFLMDYEHLGFVEAVEELAAMAGLEVPRQTTSVASADRGAGDLYDVMQQAVSFYRGQLRHHAQAQRAIEYLKGRGLSGEIAAEFGIGFAPPGWDGLLKALGGSADARALLARAGLIAEKDDGGAYDRFRDRIMFPIRDRRGRAIAFGGRILAGDGPKYLNSPETPIFHKGRELYGLFEARKALRRIERLLVVEGYMDVVALAQHGIRNAVATLGTATTTDHLEVLYRVAPEVVFCFDGDRAGREAAWRALDNALPAMGEGRQARFLFLPEGEDPDTLVRREGADAFAARIDQATPLSVFFFEALRRRADTSTVDGRARLTELAKPYLQRLRDPVFKTLMIKQLEAFTGLDRQRLESALNLGPTPSSSPRRGPGMTRPRTRTRVQLAIALLLDQPDLGSRIEPGEGLRSAQIPGISLLLELLEIVRSQPHLTTGGLLERWRERPEFPHLAKLAGAELVGSPEQRCQEFIDTLAALARHDPDPQLQALRAKEAAEGLTEDLKNEWIQFVRSIEASKRKT